MAGYTRLKAFIELFVAATISRRLQNPVLDVEVIPAVAARCHSSTTPQNRLQAVSLLQPLA
ncbi:hypothetical protein DPM33_28290 [Mesorhizobium hawassense]|uniref:Uncharacterized protein n=1 Tax=Mesorhizobium hawassense TaxID=1209954 RepID=A0A330HE87_9HYPH|nr:hypothetical protein DPM33_28290 [Mesorhizobium hawassense]